MILRRFTKHITDQNWFAVGLDVLVVITGIFLGMQVSEWNDVKKQNEEGIYHLTALMNFIEKDITDQAEEIKTSTGHMGNTFNAWSILLNDKVKEKDKKAFEKNHMGAFYLWGPKSKPAILNRIIEGGKLDMVRSRDIQRAILKFDNHYNEAIYQTNASYEYSKDITLIVMTHIEYDKSGIRSSMGALRGDAELKAALRGKGIMQRIQLDTLKTIQAENEKLLKILKAYLGQTEKQPENTK